MKCKLSLTFLVIAIVMVFFEGFSRSSTLYGVHMDLNFLDDPTTRKLAIEKAEELKTQVSRNSFLWHRIEAQEGTRSWSIPDAVVDDLLAAGIEPLFCIYGSPSWANGVSITVDNYYLYVPTEEGTFIRWVEKYKQFVTEAVKRYKDRVKMWELWNEENQHHFWKPTPDVDKYAFWYTEIYKTIKMVDPNAQVALGGLAGLAFSGPIDYNGMAFLEKLYNRDIYPDIIAIHPYCTHAPDVHIEWQNNFDDIQLMRELMVANGQGGKQIWVTEWGWPTDKISESKQAEYVSTSLRMIDTQYPYVKVAAYFLDYDRPPLYFHGLYTNNFRLKEAGSRFKDFMQDHEPPLPPGGLKILP